MLRVIKKDMKNVHTLAKVCLNLDICVINAINTNKTPAMLEKSTHSTSQSLHNNYFIYPVQISPVIKIIIAATSYIILTQIPTKAP